MAAAGKKVVIAVDGSPQAEAAFDWYYAHLHKPEFEVTLVHVPEGPTVTTSQGMHLNAGEIQKMIEKEKEETQKLQAKYLSKLVDKHSQATYHTEYGKAGEALVAAAENIEACLIVMGTRGQGKLRRTVLGSVSDYVVHHSHCAVIVYRH